MTANNPESGDDMTATESPEQADLGERAARWLGDLDHPFYDDERNRWVWYEASTIGLQVALIGSYLAAGIAILVNGLASLGLIIFMMMPTTIGSLFAQAYVSRHSADYAPSLFDLRRGRGLFVVAALLFMAAAVLIRGFVDGDYRAIGIVVALFAGAVAGVAASRSRRSKLDDAYPSDDLV